jgi:hypothetical protein
MSFSARFAREFIRINCVGAFFHGCIKNVIKDMSDLFKYFCGDEGNKTRRDFIGNGFAGSFLFFFGFSFF